MGMIYSRSKSSLGPVKLEHKLSPSKVQLRGSHMIDLPLLKEKMGRDEAITSHKQVWNRRASCQCRGLCRGGPALCPLGPQLCRPPSLLQTLLPGNRSLFCPNGVTCVQPSSSIGPLPARGTPEAQQAVPVAARHCLFQFGLDVSLPRNCHTSVGLLCESEWPPQPLPG